MPRIQMIAQKQMETIYRDHMRRTFPAAELKPLSVLSQMREKGLYHMVGYWSDQPNDSSLLAYACLYCGHKPGLLDYYAVVENQRGKGVGSAFLKALLGSPLAPAPVLVELEAPEAALNSAQRTERLRRLAFYRRLGFLDTTVRMSVFDVAYHVFAFGSEAGVTQTTEDYMDIYQGMLPAPIVQEKVVCLSCSGHKSHT